MLYSLTGPTNERELSFALQVVPIAGFVVKVHAVFVAVIVVRLVRVLLPTEILRDRIVRFPTPNSLRSVCGV